jgi:hypothetical protein
MIAGVLLCGLLAAISLRAPEALEGYHESARAELYFRQLLTPLPECVREARQEIGRLQARASDMDGELYLVELDFAKRVERWHLEWIPHANKWITISSSRKWAYLRAAFYLNPMPVKLTNNNYEEPDRPIELRCLQDLPLKASVGGIFDPVQDSE